MQKSFLTRALTLTLALGAPLPALAQQSDIAGIEWQLLAVDGTRFAPGTTLLLDADGRLSGAAPCNRYMGENGATLPALAFDRVAATMMACPALEAEGVYLRALADVREARVEAGHLFLTGAEGGAPVLEYVRDLGDKALICKSCAD